MARNIGNTGETRRITPNEIRERGFTPIDEDNMAMDGSGDGMGMDGLSGEPELDADGSAALGRANRHGKKKKGPIVAIICGAVAVLGVGGYFVYTNMFAGAAADDKANDGIVAAYVDDGKIYGGVKALGIELGGMTKDDAYAWLLNESSQKVNGTQMQFTVNGQNYTLNGEQLGAHIEVEPLLEQAASYGREGGFSERQQAIMTAETQGVDLPVDMAFSQEKIKAAVDEVIQPLSVEPVNATIEIIPNNDESSMTIGYEKKVVEGKNGLQVDSEKLAADIYAAAEAGDFTTPVVADSKEVPPAITAANIEEQYTARGVYATDFTSSSNRNYNIWKMSGIINGVKIEPGETWSINDEAGPRTSGTGWKDAPGIRNGEYVDEPGGGICQVSSTLYGAVIRAEVKIADRSHHSWPLSYVPGGLDATISTGAPDFKITNNFDIPIYIVVDCNVSDQKLKVAILGPPYEDGLTRDFTSELTGTSSGGGVVEIPDESLPAGQRVTQSGGREGKTYRVDKIWRDADGNEVKRETGWSIETYRPFGSIVRVGTGAPAPVPEPEPPAPEPPAPDPPAPDPPAPDPPAPDPPAPDPGTEG